MFEWVYDLWFKIKKNIFKLFLKKKITQFKYVLNYFGIIVLEL